MDEQEIINMVKGTLKALKRIFIRYLEDSAKDYYVHEMDVSDIDGQEYRITLSIKKKERI